jgi:hypothetical protein
MTPTDPVLLMEPALSLALEGLASPEPEGILPVLADARLFATLLKDPDTRPFDPETRFAPLAALLRHPRREIHIGRGGPCLGDADVAAALVMLLARCAETDGDTVLTITLDTPDDTPAVRLELDGPGRFPDSMHLGHGMVLSMAEAERRWTAATRGGRFDREPGVVILRLTGIREPEELPGCPASFLNTIVEAHRRALLALNPEATGNTRADDLAAAAAALGQALAFADGTPRGEAVGLRALAAEAAEAWRGLLDHAAISLEMHFPEDLPPLVADRGALARVVAGALRHAWCSLPRGGLVTLGTEYDPGARRATLSVTIAGTQCSPDDTAPLASVRRTTAALPGGTFETEADGGEWLILVALDDRAGRELDAWIPGWDRFSDQAQAMLRLLKSGGQAPPESLILDGILESELERWLMAVLAAPPAVNRAHDLKPDVGGLPGASGPRAAKVLEQTRRGKPRKDICRPPHAGEIAWLFRDETGRRALNAENLSQEDFEVFARAAVSSPPDTLAALRVLARR